MLKVKILCVGKLKEKYLQLGVNEYSKRLSRYCKLEIIELVEDLIGDNPSDAQIEQVKEHESQHLLEKIKEREYVIVLDVWGEQKSSPELATYIDKVAQLGMSSLVFVIGGSYGISDALRKKAQLNLSLSKATFTHQMTRLILIEQIYRSFKILNHETYHK